MGAALTSGAEAEHQEGTGKRVWKRVPWGRDPELSGEDAAIACWIVESRLGCSKLGPASRGLPSGGASGNHWQVASRCLQGLLRVAGKLSLGVLVELYKLTELAETPFSRAPGDFPGKLPVGMVLLRFTGNPSSGTF